MTFAETQHEPINSPPHPRYGGGELEVIGPVTDQRHSLLVREDWTVETAHDLRLERTVAALGGAPCPCVSYVDYLVPALRLLVRRHCGLEPVRLEPTEHSPGWRLLVHTFSCECGNRDYRSVRSAAIHVSTVRHIVDEVGTASWRPWGTVDVVALQELAVTSGWVEVEPPGRNRAAP